jgi:MYXO-CTERM domain-containing protein
VSRWANADQASVDFSIAVRPMSHAGSGFLHSFTPTSPSDALIAPLKPQLFRDWPDGGDGGGAFNNYARATALGAKMQVVVSDGYSNYTTFPGDNADYSNWENYCRNLAIRATVAGAHLQYDIWNEPDIGYFWNRPETQFLETWKRGYQAIRLIDPLATIVGPSLSNFNSTSEIDVNKSQFKVFIDYAKANNVLPDILSWHEFSGSFPARVDDARAYLAANSINISRFSLNEIVSSSDMTKAGVLPRYFAQLERAGIESVTHACWDEPSGVNNGNNQSLDGLLTADTKQPRSTWWTYERYGKMSGTTAESTNGSTVDAVASFEAGKAYILMGRFRTTTDTSADVLLQHLDFVNNLIKDGKIHILAERIDDSGFNAATAPLAILDADYPIVNNQLLLTLPNFGVYDSYFLTITSPVPEPSALGTAMLAALLLRRRRRQP